MILNIIKQFNWVDIFIIILLFRICYIAIKNGFSVELFKLLGTLMAIYLSLHYFTLLSDLIGKRVSAERVPLEFLDFLVFVVLVMVGYAVWIILREFICRFIKMEAVPTLNKWGGFILGIGRGILLTSLIIFMLVISSISYFKNSVHNSYSGRRLFKVAPLTYSALWNNLMSKFMPKEKFNKTILEVQENFASP